MSNSTESPDMARPSSDASASESTASTASTAQAASDEKESKLVLQQRQAGPMGNFLYTLADPKSHKAFLFDPAWEPLEQMQRAAREGFTVEAVVLTHTHQDHVGGELFGNKIPGVRELIAEHPELPVYVHESEAQQLLKLTGIPEVNVRVLIDEATLDLGEVSIRCMHTPGHSPGGVSFLSSGHLISGDTLFVQGVGRVDLPGSDPDALFYSLRRLVELPPQTKVFAGHHTGGEPSSTIGREIDLNPYLRPKTIEQWRMMMGVF